MKLRISLSKPMGVRSKPNEGCKRHPKHRQSPGVCSLCLVDKLSKLSPLCTTFTTKIADSNCSSSSSFSSYSSSTSDSDCSSPMHRYRFSKDHGKGTSFSLLWFSGKNLLTKSRSVASVSTSTTTKDYDYNSNHKKEINGGFFSKLIR